jgi:hypothetical protein
MLYLIEESDDCGVHWRRAELTYCYFHPHVAVLEALTIIQDEWQPPEDAWRQLVYALQDESVAFFWEKGIRVVQVDKASRAAN